jgi:hypothetical protein
VIDQQNMVFIPNERRAKVFAGSDHELIVNMVPWDEMKSKLSKSTIQRSFKFVVQKTPLEIKQSILRDFNLKVTHVEMQKMMHRQITKESPYEDMEYLIKMIQSDPKKVANAIQ